MSLPFRAKFDMDRYPERDIAVLRGSELLLDPKLVRWDFLSKSGTSGFGGQPPDVPDAVWLRDSTVDNLNTIGLAWLRIAADSPRGVEAEVQAAARKAVTGWGASEGWARAWGTLLECDGRPAGLAARERPIPLVGRHVRERMPKHVCVGAPRPNDDPIPWPFWICPQLRTKRPRNLNVPVAPAVLATIRAEIGSSALGFMDHAFSGPTKAETRERLSLALRGGSFVVEKPGALGSPRQFGYDLLMGAGKRVGEYLAEQEGLSGDDREALSGLFTNAFTSLHDELAPLSLEFERREVTASLIGRLLQRFGMDERPDRSDRWFPKMSKELRLYVVGRVLISVGASDPPARSAGRGELDAENERAKLVVKQMQERLRTLRAAITPTASPPEWSSRSYNGPPPPPSSLWGARDADDPQDDA